MKIIHTVAEMRAWRQNRKNVALVPTMGNLHDGHLALVREARRRAEHTAVSVFVNRLQFGQGEDFDAYPRTLQADAAKLEAAGVDVLFAPDERELYPRGGQDFNVEPPSLQNELCGRFRPGHFRGVATVVLKLLNITRADIACFGKKDYQQLVIIRGMVDDLNVPVTIVPVDTGRAPDGLALSSRNAYLSAEERTRAPELYHALCAVAEALRAGDGRFAVLESEAEQKLTAKGWQVDYVAVRRADDLRDARPDDRETVVLAAARLGKTRLIDNIEVTRP